MTGHLTNLGAGLRARRKIRLHAMMFMTLLALVAHAQVSPDYARLKRIVSANTGFAHLTRGMNMVTLIALRSCVSTKDIGVLSQMLQDPDRIVSMTAANVLVDLGDAGKQAVKRQLDNPGRADRTVLNEALWAAASATYRPIMEYASREPDRSQVRRGCLPKTTRP
jgi:hypothetical protein